MRPEAETSYRREAAVKIHTKKKAERAAWKALAKEGRMPNAAGNWSNRGSMPDNAMKRDFYPQSGK